MKRFKSFLAVLLILIIILPGVDVFACEFNKQLKNDDYVSQFDNNETAAENTQPETTADNNTTAAETSNNTSKTLEIKSEEDFIEFVQNCVLDTYSVNLQVSLDGDLDLSGYDFEGIPWFQGTFYGNGHTISGVEIVRDGVNSGFFRTVGENGTISGLNIIGNVSAGGTAENAGGIAGDNFGKIISCSFEGSVEGLTCVGGITGLNEENGCITSCKFGGFVKGEHQVGGISGENKGTIAVCTNSGLINTEAIIVSQDKSETALSKITSGILDISEEDILDVTDIGGIAGLSSGIIYSCENKETVGYKHIGYNVGGICGRSSGYISECTSSGEVYGKNDTGGIVGQLEPYAEWDLSGSNLAKLKDCFSELENNVNALKSDFTYATSETASALSVLFAATSEMQNAFADVSQQVEEGMDEAVTEIVDTIDYINETNLRQKLKDLIEKLKDFSPDTRGLTETITKTAAATENLKNVVLGVVNAAGNVGDSMSGYSGIYGDINAVSDSITNIINTGLKTAEDIGISEDYLNDVSITSAYSENRGAVDKCENNADVHGDTGIGGIVGTIDFEISFDLENQLNLSDYLFGNARYNVFSVVRDCSFNSDIEVKKANAGGICGKENFGLLINSAAEGSIKSDEADYVGGAAGLSSASIIKCFSRMNLNGASYIGGIAGKGNNISGCVAYCFIDSGSEMLGGICGSADGTIENNYYVADINLKKSSDDGDTDNKTSKVTGGIDGVDYAGKAQSMTYEEMCKIEGIPDSFKKIEVSFVKDGEVVDVYEVEYGGSISETPDVPSEDGKYWKWEDFQRENITNSFTVNGSFNEPIKTISTDEEIPMFLAEGSFNEGQKLVVEEIEAGSVYSLEITDFEGPAVIRMKGTNLDVSLKTSNEETKAVETTEDGSYTVFTVDLPCTIEVKENIKQKTWIVYVVVGAAAAAVIIVLVILFKRRKNKNLCQISDDKEDNKLIEGNGEESMVEKTDKNDSEELKNGEESNEV